MTSRIRFRSQWMSRSTLKARPTEIRAQDLWNEGRARIETTPNAQSGPGSLLVGILLLAVTLGATYAFASELYRALALHNGGTPLHFVFLAISTLSFSWIAFGAANAAVGMCALFAGTKGNSLQPAPPGAPARARTALLFPIYHEDPHVIAAYIRGLARELEAVDALSLFSVFVISDSQTDEDRAAERVVFKQLATEINPRLTFAYRNRRQNDGKKAGNIADWLRSHGGAYDYFVVFDADSVMSVDTLIRLVRTMELHSDTALIQTVPRLSTGGTIFSRLQAFANNVFGPLSAAGLAAWQGASGNYWGHNAIIRTRAFADCAGLPVLPGDPPWGGHIQSHDFVEAALLRRAGWRVALISGLEGTSEQSPPTFVDMAVRDRRWMQGNLQHLRILGAFGLTPVSRVHLAMGIVSYLASVLWLLVILVGLWLMWIEQHRVISYFDSTKSLFPHWPTYDPAAALQLLIATMAVVFMPKLLGLADAIGRMVRDGRSLGEIRRFLGLWGLELLHSMFLAPVTMLNHVRALLQIVLRQDAGWKPQARSGTTIALSDAFRFHIMHVSVGAVLAVAAASIAWHAFFWLAPVVLGLVISPLITWLTSHPLSTGPRSLVAEQSAAPMKTDVR
jgi:membrane glycosyltransferase